MSDERVERIHRDGVVVDLVTNLLTEGVLRSIEDFRAGGVHLICQSIDPPWRLSALARPHLDLAPDPQTALRTIAWVRRLVQERDDLAFIETVDDVHAAKASGRLGVMLHSQNATPFGFDLDLVAELYAAGLRMSGLAYNVRRRSCGSCPSHRSSRRCGSWRSTGGPSWRRARSSPCSAAGSCSRSWRPGGSSASPR